MILHGYEITFRHQDWSLITVGGKGFASGDEAKTAARRAAVELWYRTPKWWEFWRWKESDILYGSDRDGTQGVTRTTVHGDENDRKA